MAMEEANSFKVSLPDEFLPLVHDMKIGKNIDDKVRVSLAMGMFVGKQVTLARAAELAGKSLVDFIDILRTYDIYWSEYTEQHFSEDQLAIDEIMKEKEKKHE